MLNKLLGVPFIFSIILVSWKSTGELHVVVAEHSLPLIFWTSRGYWWILCHLPSLSENDCSHGFSVELTLHVSLQCFGSASKSTFLCRKTRHFTISWCNCDVIIWPCQQWQNFQSLGGEKEEEGVKCKVHTLSNLDCLFLLLIFDWHGDHVWLRCMTLRSKRWLRTSYKWPRHQELQFCPWSWLLSLFLEFWGEQRCGWGGSVPGEDVFRDSFNQDTLSG